MTRRPAAPANPYDRNRNGFVCDERPGAPLAAAADLALNPELVFAADDMLPVGALPDAGGGALLGAP
ncbi:hypothetical protein [Gemmatimonas sp.]